MNEEKENNNSIVKDLVVVGTIAVSLIALGFLVSVIKEFKTK
jgi:hypothetical protein